MFTFTALRDEKKRPQGRAAIFWRGVEEGGIGPKNVQVLGRFNHQPDDVMVTLWLCQNSYWK